MPINELVRRAVQRTVKMCCCTGVTLHLQFVTSVHCFESKDITNQLSTVFSDNRWFVWPLNKLLPEDEFVFGSNKSFVALNSNKQLYNITRTNLIKHYTVVIYRVNSQNSFPGVFGPTQWTVSRAGGRMKQFIELVSMPSGKSFDCWLILYETTVLLPDLNRNLKLLVRKSSSRVKSQTIEPVNCLWWFIYL